MPAVPDTTVANGGRFAFLILVNLEFHNIPPVVTAPLCNTLYYINGI